MRRIRSRPLQAVAAVDRDAVAASAAAHSLGRATACAHAVAAGAGEVLPL